MESNWKKRFILLNGPRKKINNWHNQRRQLMQFCCSWCLNLKWCILAKNEYIGQIFFFIFLWKADRNNLTSHTVLMKLSWGYNIITSMCYIIVTRFWAIISRFFALELQENRDFFWKFFCNDPNTIYKDIIRNIFQLEW